LLKVPKRTDIQKILVIGAGPIVIGQACEFDYSGTQGCKALKEEGYEVILVNSNPATIMTDPEFAHRTYIEPITPEIVRKIIEKERPDALLPTLGGQTALNTAVALAENGTLKEFKVELIGAKLGAIKKAEDRQLFKEAMQRIGLDIPNSATVTDVAAGKVFAEKQGYPLIIRPAFTLGGTGGGVCYNRSEFEEMLTKGLEASPVHQCLVEESALGWKEYEMEVMRDLADNVVIICSIENLDPMGIHTGDSITVAPIQTLTDKEYQKMRDASIAVIREIGVDTGGSNIQFGMHPKTGRMVVIEMNPRVSRSSALASKATGFPIAKIAAKLAVGYTLDELFNDITKYTKAAFEPTIDYVVTKIPRFTFEKFTETEDILTTAMKSVGETMAIGRTFKESLQKAYRSLELGYIGFGADGREFLDGRWQKTGARKPKNLSDEILEQHLKKATSDRHLFVRQALWQGYSVEKINALTAFDPWFLNEFKLIVDMEKELEKATAKKAPLSKKLPADLLRRAKSYGFSDAQLAFLCGVKETALRKFRKGQKVLPVYRMVDTCAAEFEAFTPYLYSTYEPFKSSFSGKKEDFEATPTQNHKIAILGGGPNRIGQGIEFDYCCVHGAFALKEDGYEVIMVNNNPETVSTDYDTSSRLYFEPLTFEDVMNILDREKPQGVVVQFGGQTPLKLAVPLQAAGAPIIGTSPESIDVAEDRKLFGAMLRRLKIRQPDNGIAMNAKQARPVAQKVGYPVMIRPSYVLGGRAMEVAYDEMSIDAFVAKAMEAAPNKPILIDHFLEDAIEVDVDCVCDGKDVVVAGIMEHIEEAGIHSGDSACVIPPHTLRHDQIDTIRQNTRAMALALKVKGLMNVQYAIRNDLVYVLEVNPRASRTVPFVSKATGTPWAKVAVRLMAGKTIAGMGIKETKTPKYVSVKEAVFPFNRFPGVDTVLGPEMKSTGEVMGIDRDFGTAFAKSQIAAWSPLPTSGTVFLSIKNKDKRRAVFVAKILADLGFKLVATEGTAAALVHNGLEVTQVKKVIEGRPNIVDLIKDGGVQLIMNTPVGKGPRSDDYQIRRAAVQYRVPTITTLSGCEAVANAIESMKKREFQVCPLQDHHASMKNG
jgi:carbamoyl-phosphate synthase large subunit